MPRASYDNMTEILTEIAAKLSAKLNAAGGATTGSLTINKALYEYRSTLTSPTAASGSNVAYYKCTSNDALSINAATIFPNADAATVRFCFLILDAADYAPSITWSGCTLFVSAPSLTEGKKTIINFLATDGTTYLIRSVTEAQEV